MIIMILDERISYYLKKTGVDSSEGSLMRELDS
jgi:hypothetical protein